MVRGDVSFKTVDRNDNPLSSRARHVPIYVCPGRDASICARVFTYSSLFNDDNDNDTNSSACRCRSVIALTTASRGRKAPVVIVRTTVTTVTRRKTTRVRKTFERRKSAKTSSLRLHCTLPRGLSVGSFSGRVDGYVRGTSCTIFGTLIELYAITTGRVYYRPRVCVGNVNERTDGRNVSVMMF